MVDFYQTEIRIRNSKVYANENKGGSYNHKTVPRIKVTLQATKLHSFGAGIREDLKLFKSWYLLYLNTGVQRLQIRIFHHCLQVKVASPNGIKTRKFSGFTS